jgi:hypothetical protein
MKQQASLHTIGWREWIVFPDFEHVMVKAKVDSGARSSSLHAEAITFVKRKRSQYVQFLLLPLQKSKRGAVQVTAPLVDVRHIRSSNGQVEKRPVITVPIVLHDQLFETEITLSQRDLMGFRMLLGRQALKGRFTIDVNHSYVGGQPISRRKKKSK